MSATGMIFSTAPCKRLIQTIPCENPGRVAIYQRNSDMVSPTALTFARQVNVPAMPSEALSAKTKSMPRPEPATFARLIEHYRGMNHPVLEPL